ncbi:MAG: YSC84-related protein [Gammaproteobacteria bacterium]|jgi:lipid-binding SYLF domain-containing protein
MKKSALFTTTLLILSLAAGCAGWQANGDVKPAPGYSDPEVAQVVGRFMHKDPGIRTFFKQAYGYAIFPTITKAAITVGGAHGGGKVYRGHRVVGTTSLTQATVGLQLGVQSYSEIIFFKDKATFDDFTKGNFEFDAQASAVAVTAGAAANADYSNGVATFTLARGGLMYEASVGGQKFTFTPVD